MRDPDSGLLLTAQRWLAGGQRVALATLARATGRPPRPLGSMLAVRGDGALAGAVSGGCVEETLAQDMCSGRLAASGGPRLLRFGEHDGRVERVALPCGGGIELLLEPAVQPAPLAALLGALGGGATAVRRVCLETGEVSVHRAAQTGVLEFDGRDLRRRFGPSWRLLVAGGGDLARGVAELALALEATVSVCEPRRHWAQGWDLDGVTLSADMPDEAFAALDVDASTAVLALSHDPTLDDLLLAAALASPAFYVGALGSRRNAGQRRRRLRALGVGDDALGRLRCPAGLALGGRSSTAIALSIVAEITAARHGTAAAPASAALHPA